MSHATDVGGIKARIEVDVSGCNAGIEKAKAKISELGTQGKKTAEDCKAVETALDQVGSSADKLNRLIAQLDNVNARIERQKTKLATLKQAYEQTFNEARKSKLHDQILQTEAALLRLTHTSDHTAQKIWKLEDKLSGMGGQAVTATGKIKGVNSALVALGAGAVLKKVITEMRDFVAESERMFNATKGLAEVSKHLGYGATVALEEAQSTAAKGFMNLTESAQAYKTALAMGLDIEQTTKLIHAMADAAAYNRQAHYSWGESIVVAMEGIKNGNSTLTDSVGVTKNLSVMQEEYARSIGTTAAKLTDAQKVQAAYNGFLQESQLFAGNAETALAEYTGTVASYENEMQKLKATLGDSIKPLFAELMELITPIITGLAKWISENKTLVTGLIGAATTITGLIAVIASVVAVVNVARVAFAGLATAAMGLNIALGPIGWAIAGIAAVATGVSMYAASAKEAEQKAREMAEAQRKLNEELDKSPLTRNAGELKKLQSEYEQITKLVGDYHTAQKELQELMKKPPHPYDKEAMQNLSDARKKFEEIKKVLADMGVPIEEATGVLLRMKEQIDASAVAAYEMNRTEYDGLATKRAHQEEMERLIARYHELNAVQQLTNEQDIELKETINALKKEYPDLVWAIDEQGRARISNIGVVDGQIQAERSLADASLQAAKARIQHEIEVTKANKAQIEAQIQNYQRLLEAMSAAMKVESPFERMSPKLKVVMGIQNKFLQEEWKKEKAEKETQLADSAEALKKMEKSKQGLSTGEFIPISKGRRGGSGGKGSRRGSREGTGKTSGKSPAELAKEHRDKAYDADMATTRFKADMYDWDANQQIAAYEKVRARHKQHLKETVEDERTMSLQLKRLREDTAKSKYEFSAEWIAKEERRMQDANRSEMEVTKTKLDAWSRLRGRYKKGSEEYKQADEQVYQSRKQLSQAQFDFSSEWVEQEARRMEEAKKSEQEITQFKLAAWIRLRDRYEKQSAFYKKADEQVYQTKKKLIEENETAVKEQQKLVEEMHKKQKSATEDARKSELKSLEDAKKADLKAIEERKKAAVGDYEERMKAIDRLIAKEAEWNVDADHETKLAEKRARLALLESAVGPEGIKEREDIAKEIERMQLEHDRELRKRSLEQQKQGMVDERSQREQAFEHERSQREQAFEREKSDVEAKYEALKVAFDNFSGDVQTIESAISEFRIQSSGDTNAAILSDLDTFVREYNAKMSQIQTMSAYESDLNEYNENKDAWVEAKARRDRTEMARLHARNRELRSKHGINRDNGKLPSFDVGGVVPGPVGHPLFAVVHGGEAVFNPSQLSKLFALLDAPLSAMRHNRPAAVPQSIVNNIDLSANVTLEDNADIQTFHAERERAVRRFQASGGAKTT